MNYRLDELQQKEELTTAEMDELVRLSPKGRFMLLPQLQHIGVVNIQKSMSNLQDGAAKSKHALQQGCFIEVIALRTQHAEFWLRMFWAAKNTNGKIFAPSDKRTFGVIINHCIALGLPQELGDRLQAANQHRIDAVHKYLLGETDYAALGEACTANQGLDADVRAFVVMAIGQPAQGAQELIGQHFVTV